MSLAEAPWWPGFVASLKMRSLARLSVDLGVPEAELEAELVRTDPGGPATAAPWWPEVVRLRSAVPIRALARRFGCEPRRLRRSLARQGWRAGGVETDRRGVPLLAGMLDRLGREPDGTIAREAGVSVEAVQGERKRLRIQPFRPGANQLTAEEEAWVRGPQRQQRIRHRVDEEALQVVRRPLRSSEVLLRGPGVARAPRDERPNEAFRREGAEPAAAPRPEAPEVVRTVGRGEPRREEPWRGRAGDDPPTREDGQPPRRVGAAFFWEERGRDIERLLTPASRLRDGRQRIVRAEERRDDAPALTRAVSLREVVRPEPAPRPRLGPVGPSWRKVDPTQVQLPEEEVEAPKVEPVTVEARKVEPWVPPARLPEVRREDRPLPARLVAATEPVGQASEGTRKSAPPTVVPAQLASSLPAAPGRAKVAAPSAPSAPVAAATAAPTPARSTTVAPARATTSAKVHNPQIALPFGPAAAAAHPPSAQVPQLFVPSASAGTGDVWEVTVGSPAPPMVFRGVDLVTALRLAAARVTPEEQQGMAIVRAGARPVDLTLAPVTGPLPVFD